MQLTTEEESSRFYKSEPAEPCSLAGIRKAPCLDGRAAPEWRDSTRVSGQPPALLNAARQPWLICALCFCRQTMIRSVFGISEAQNRNVSLMQAERCSDVAW